MPLSERAQRWFESKWLALHLAILAMLLCLPALNLGLQVDDNFHKVAISDPPILPEWQRTAFSLFEFFTADDQARRDAIVKGAAPWWTSDDLVLSFARPLTGITHWIDHRLWPDHPWLMHLQSLLWFAAAIFAATAFFRRIMSPPWIAGLAALIFAIDDGHGIPAVWIANRNAVIAVFFCLLSLIAHDRWRRDGFKPGLYLSPIALLAGLLSNEGAASTCAYLAAYALFIDKGAIKSRLLSLTGCATVAATWLFTYKALGYGAKGSWVYVDPGGDFLGFLSAVFHRAPLLLAGQLGFPADLNIILSLHSQLIFLIEAWVILVTVTAISWPLLRHDRVARFFVFGAVLAVLPACSTFVATRLLFYVSIGGAGFLALLLRHLFQTTGGYVQELTHRAAAYVLIVLHFVISPIALVLAAETIKTVGTYVSGAASSLPSEPGIENQIFFVVSSPSAFIATHGPLHQLVVGERVPDRLIVLGTGIHQSEVSRPTSQTLVIRPDRGFLAPHGTPSTTAPKNMDLLYAFQLFDYLYADKRPWREGPYIDLEGIEVSILELTEDQRPAAVSFRFPKKLDDESYRWLVWNDGVFVEFELPGVGGHIIVPAVTFGNL